jgi:hypothetical protein
MSRIPARPDGNPLQRGVGSRGILQIFLGSIIGSGWLFGALPAAGEAAVR